MKTKKDAAPVGLAFPYRPAGLLHKHGGRIVVVHGIKHRTFPPQDGRSRDDWFYIADVQWHGSEAIAERREIGAWAICCPADDEAAFAEVRALNDALMAYLRANGEWCDADSEHEGWYAHRRQRKEQRA